MLTKNNTNKNKSNINNKTHKNNQIKKNYSSTKKHNHGLFIFHRDFRIKDNLGLFHAASQCAHVYTCFIFTPEQATDKNRFKSQNAVQFMIESLAELQRDILGQHGKLIVLYGEHDTMVDKLIKELDINCVFFNRDYTPYSQKRDQDIMKLCENRGISCESSQDYYLQEPGSVKNGQGGYYHKFNAYYGTMLRLKVAEPIRINVANFAKSGKTIPGQITLDQAMSKFVENPNPEILVRGGRELGLKRLKMATNAQKDYDEKRDILNRQTTLLSAYIKFGCISIREVYHTILAKFGRNHGIIRELIWRDFFAHLLFAYPDMLGHSYNPHFEKIQWVSPELKDNNTDWLHRWKTGTTGFPVVDACMRELNHTGYMHNRGRMVVANFLVKTLLLDWRDGELYFAQQLTDYDVASNNGNWSSIVGGGAYAMPYFRVMNPWIQSEKFDKEGEYIKKWVPELNEVLPKDIHQWLNADLRKKYTDIKYPEPMVDYQEQKKKVMALYKKYL